MEEEIVKYKKVKIKHILEKLGRSETETRNKFLQWDLLSNKSSHH